MNKFSEFIKDEKNATVENSTQLDDNISALIEKYSKLSNDELMSEFIKEGEKKKQNGELDDNHITKIKSILAPYLSQEQSEKLNNLLNKVK